MGAVGGIPAFYRKRRKVYKGLLIFVIVAGLPIVFVPPMRETLSERVEALRTAITGEIPPIVMNVGIDAEPFPEVYLRPEPPIRLLAQSPASSRSPGTPSPEQGSVLSGKTVSKPAAASDRGHYQPPLFREDAGMKAQDPGAVPEKSQDGPVYSQGEKDREAYELVLKSNVHLAGMVRGDDPVHRFKSWGSTHRGGDLYWVRITIQSDEPNDQDYIWEVYLEAGRVVPLSFHARRIS
jgi:hypothetical protein